MKSVFYTLGSVVAVVIVGGFAFVLSGIYYVGADLPDPAPLKWLIHTTMERSVDSASGSVVVPADLDTPARIAEGGRHYKEMCAECHLAPGMASSELRQGLNPEPPDLPKTAPGIPAQEIFWVVKHGVKMTAMPAWGKTHDDQKLWAITAFVKYRLPGLSPADYAKIKAESDDDQPGSSSPPPAQ